MAAQIANRLAYAIPNTVIARLDSATFTAIENAPSKTYNILEWIAYDTDSFGYTGTPGWSGFCDVNDTINTGTNKISAPGSDLSLAHTIIGKLSANTKNLSDAGILFPSTYDVNTVGFGGSPVVNAPGVSKVNPVTAGAIIPLGATVPAGAPRTVKEHYKLAWTAYAIVPTELTAAQYAARDLSATDKIYDLVLHYNFQPWDGIHYGAATVTTLIRNVSVFNFLGTGDTIRFKLCVQENIGGAYPITMCKEKAVIR